jgi:hypothetical protein
MLTGNLSTRPFYNERLVVFALGVLAAIVVLLTIFNARSLLVLTRERATARAQVTADQTETARLQAQIASLERGLDRNALAALVASSREANDLIRQRTFSWTSLFATLEKKMPADVRLLSVSPQVDNGTLRVSMTVVTRELEDVHAFVEALFSTGTFYDAAPAETQWNEDGTYTALVTASYLASERKATPAATAGGARR